MESILSLMISHKRMSYPDVLRLLSTCSDFWHLQENDNIRIILKAKRRGDTSLFIYKLGHIRKMYDELEISEEQQSIKTNMIDTLISWETMIRKRTMEPKLPYCLSLSYDILCQIEETLESTSAMSDEFELMELFLHRYCHQSLFILDDGIISDPDAKKFWDDNFPGRESIKMRELRALSPFKEEPGIHPILEYLLNFPQDKVITQYKFNILTSIFGPWDNLIPSIKYICSKWGFLGYISRRQAEEHLSGGRYILLRMSRSQPDKLVLSWNRFNGEGNDEVLHLSLPVWHERKERSNIPHMEEYYEMILRTYDIEARYVKLRLNFEDLKNQKLSDYIQENDRRYLRF